LLFDVFIKDFDKFYIYRPRYFVILTQIYFINLIESIFLLKTSQIHIHV
ncbi:MAG: hypothetical protein UU46_C0020G0015, partial [Candidatus Uhrbacteria bacterium GW2011_GWD1_41_16]